MDRSVLHPNPITFNSPRRQYFPLPTTIINYILKNQFSGEGLIKLQKTCKYFFAKSKVIILNNFFQYEPTYFFDNNNDDAKSKHFVKGIKYWITHSLAFQNPPNFFKSIYRCTYETLRINEQNLTLSELDFLLNGGNLQEIGLTNVNIFNTNKIRVSIDQILSKNPQLLYLKYKCEDEIFTQEILTKMNFLKFNEKFNKCFLFIYNLEENVDITLLTEFVRKNSNKNSDFLFGFEMNDSENYISTFESALDETFQIWVIKDIPTVLCL